MNGRRFALVVAACGLAWCQAHAQESADLSHATANPLANFMSFPIQSNNDFGIGQFDRTRNVLNIQPVVPLANGRFIARAIFPIVWLPDMAAESGTFSSGLSDILLTAFYTPAAGTVMWGVGPVLEIPSGGENRGTQKWSLGASAVAVGQTGGWTLGILVNNVWSIAGDSQRGSVSRGLVQYFITRQLGDGWSVSTSPIISVNWKAAEGQRWVVPFGAGVGKLTIIGRLPVSASVGAFYNVVKPDVGADWQFRVSASVLLPVPGSR